MIWRISTVLFLFVILSSCKEKKETKTFSIPTELTGYHSTKHLIDIETLKVALNDENVKVIDFRSPEAYAKGHIPNALNIWRPDIEDTTYAYKGMAANKETLEKIISGLGIQQSDIIIIYDDKGLCDAARLWWVLKNYNFNEVKLLNGGWIDWKNSKGEISMNIPKTVPSKFKFANDLTNDYLIHKDSLSVHLERKDVVLIDSRSSDEFTGKRMKSGAKRAGRIPNSFNIDWLKSIETSNQKFKSREVLEKVYAKVGEAKDQPIVAYCHTGVRSAHTTFVLTELLGYSNVRNYDGSWSEWSFFEHLPTEKDSVTKVLN